MAKGEMKQITITVPALVLAGTEAMAKKARTKLPAYVGQLFLAAYSARAKPPTGDRDLDAAVARVAILWVEERNTADIAEAVGLQEATVVRVLDAWRDEMGWAA